MGFLEPETSNIGYLDPLGIFASEGPDILPTKQPGVVQAVLVDLLVDAASAYSHLAHAYVSKWSENQ